jgi:hypothetical protein
MRMTHGASFTNVTWLKGDASTLARVGVAGDRTIIEWPGFVRMAATASMDEAELEPLSDVDARVLAKMRGGFARAVPRYLRGATVFHAAAIASKGRAMLILGESGAGKSTSAAVACRHGASMLADDTAVGTFERDAFLVNPLEALHWLDGTSRAALGCVDDEGDAKQAVVPARVESVPLPLAAVVLLDVHDEARVDVKRLHGWTAARPLLDAALRIPLGPARSKGDFDAVAEVARVAPVYSVLRPARFSSTLNAALAAKLLELLDKP